MKKLWLLLICFNVYAADNIVNVEQIGSNNAITIEQTGTGHNAGVVLGKASDVDYTTLSIIQQGTGAKTANVEIKSGISNTVSVLQDGPGNHTASIQNFNGTGNNISITQQGSGTHDFKIDSWGTSVNNGNTVTATQTGDVGANKAFVLNLSGATGSTVNVNQGGTAPDQASMLINCNFGCGGTWSYTKY
jgi:hypothetical protein